MSSELNDTSPVPSPTTPVPSLDDPKFDYADGDVVFRSSDGTQFHVHKLILKTASPVFGNMFSVPQPPPSSIKRDQTTQEGIPIVVTQEDKDALTMLFGFCYPGPWPSLRNFNEVTTAIVLKKKFQLDFIEDYLLRRLAVWADTYPERVFAIGWTHEWKDAVMAGAKATLRRPILSSLDERIEEFSVIPADAAWRLLAYHQACSKCCVPLADRHWVTADDVCTPLGVEITPSLPTSSYCSCITNFRRSGCPPPSGLRLARWFATLMDTARDTLRITPHPSLVTSLTVIAPSLTEARSCQKCSDTAAAALDAFTRRFSEKLASAISQIDIETPF
ncbi:hypothetical protein DENSPDRAFT_835904 [Dentipellis sp. KUC8613]|nr:hypothetical protein DENSPDRAFT_835904 [Dentipellis sp. KUC8613]